MPTPKVLVITPDRLGPSMAGPAIRAAAIADAVSKQNETVLLSLNEASEQIVSGAKVVTTNGKKWVKWADVVIYQGIVLEHFRQLRKGKKIFVWTVNSPQDMRFCLEKGIDAIITNYPDIALNLRNEYLRSK